MRALPPTIRSAVNLLGSAVAGKFVPLASIFVFSHLMTVEDYGALNLFTSFIWVLAIPISFNLHTALGRYAYLPDGDLPSFLGTLQMVLGGLLLLSGIAISLASGVVVRASGLPPMTLPFLMAVVAGQLAESVLTQYAIYRQTSDQLVRVIATKALLTFALALGLLQVLQHDRHMAVIGADALLSGLLVLFTVLMLRRDTRWQFRGDLLAYMLRYSVPLIPYALSITLLAQLDRMMINHHFGKAPVGLYSLAFNVGMLFALVMSALLGAMNPRFFEHMNARRHSEVIADGRRAFAFAFLLALVLVAWGPVIVSPLVPSTYASALELIPAIAIGGLFSVMFQIWGRLMHFAHRTALLSTIATACVAVKWLCNLVLLPALGWKAAAVSSIVAYGLMAWLTAILAERSLRLLALPMRWEMALCAVLAALAAVLHWAPLVPVAELSVRTAAVLLAWPALAELLPAARWSRDAGKAVTP